MSERLFNLALAQMVSEIPASGNLSSNWQMARQLVAQAAGAGAQLVVLPENFLTFGSKSRFSLAEQKSWVAALSSMAKAHKLWLVAGTLPLQLTSAMGAALQFSEATKPYATCLVIDDNGDLRGEYRKVHLFDAAVADKTASYRESDDYRAGDAPALVPTPWGILGLAVCYDLRFPEYFRLLRSRGADFIAVPSAFTYATGKAHWQVLNRARAIENQCFILACNQGGQHSETRQTWGESMIIDPWGSVLDCRPQGEGVVMAGLDLTSIAEIRAKMPVQEHRKF